MDLDDLQDRWADGDHEPARDGFRPPIGCKKSKSIGALRSKGRERRGQTKPRGISQRRRRRL